MIPPGATLVFDLHLVKVFEGTTARSYPMSVLLENVIFGPVPDLGYFCVRVWMALLQVHKQPAVACAFLGSILTAVACDVWGPL